MLSLYELSKRDVISVPYGVKLGKIDDVQIEDKTAMVTHFIIYGKSKFFGLLGRQEDIMIPWQDIQSIGRDVILVKTIIQTQIDKQGFFSHFFD